MALNWRFPVFIVASCVAFVAILRVALAERQEGPPKGTVLSVAGVVVVGGMVFAKVGAALGWPVAVYYGLPATLAWALPPRAFRMNGRELARYLPLAMISAPLIHVLFSFFLGWNEYMPFIQVPSIQALLKSSYAG
jgi:hypothetical protein